jgi:hypothetical protein
MVTRQVTKKWLTWCRFGAFVISGIAPFVAPEQSLAEPSLANLLSAAPAADPWVKQMDLLAAQLAEIERRPFAEDAAVQRALAQARAELSRARAAYSHGALEPVLSRDVALVRAALSAADRLEARIFASAALLRLKQQADDAEAAAQLATTLLQEARAQDKPPAPEQKP